MDWLSVNYGEVLWYYGKISVGVWLMGKDWCMMILFYNSQW